ncbi:hypothetical protein D9615_002638 [Tricholomella constricta]|uniref:Thiolase C-terminal domain-containing protein n=1 Tax=Tricholomella constricta TaxID=117010 RepID=A0A8H5HMH3_9AGAR|nr:hypothetical protein D9615_002638 [Tricholomella constricta]
MVLDSSLSLAPPSLPPLLLPIPSLPTLPLRLRPTQVPEVILKVHTLALDMLPLHRKPAHAPAPPPTHTLSTAPTNAHTKIAPVLRRERRASTARVAHRACRALSARSSERPPRHRHAIPKVLEKTGLSISDINFHEINEAFVSQALYSIRQLTIPMDKINVHGGAIAIGHPLGCTGSRQVAMGLNIAKQYGARVFVTSKTVRDQRWLEGGMV